ncbi:hypothetical protein ACKWTF_010340 [Chironomus riparius]
MRFWCCGLLILFMCHVANAAVSYQLYTRQNKINGQPLVYKNKASISKSNLNSAKKNKMIIHGYGQNGRSNFNRDLKNALLAHDDYNVIVVDWSTATGSSYDTAAKNAPEIGKSIAQFIDWLKLDEGYIHVIGYDMGAHIAGLAGKNVKTDKLDKITGLDPTKRGFDPQDPSTRLAKGDARHVEVYHTNGGKYGMMEHLVDNDKYINDGKSQNAQCSTDLCSHEIAWKLYVDQVRGRNFLSYNCETVEELDGKGCGWIPSEWFNEHTGIQQIKTTNMVIV